MTGFPSTPQPPTTRAGFRRRWLTRPRLLRIGIIGMAAFVVILLVLIGLGILVLPSNPVKVTITAVQWRIDQGTNPDGDGWFGPSWLNETDIDGLPFQVASGGTFTEVISLLATGNHTLYSASTQSPFQISACRPTLPTTPVGVDDFNFSVTLVAPSVSTGSSYTLYLTLNALAPSPLPCGG